jgi:hypothetical protein
VSNSSDMAVKYIHNRHNRRRFKYIRVSNEDAALSRQATL